jgi:hypothetical protein
VPTPATTYIDPPYGCIDKKNILSCKNWSFQKYKTITTKVWIGKYTFM